MFLFRRGNKYRRQFLPCFAQHLLVGIQVLQHLAGAQLVGLGKYNGKGHTAGTQPLDKLQVDFLCLQTYIDQQKHVYQLFALQNIAVNHLLQFLHLFLGTLGKSVAWQIHQIPLVINNKVVDEQRFTGCSTGLGQILLAGEHIYQARFAYVRTTNKGVLGLGILRTHRLHRSA